MDKMVRGAIGIGFAIVAFVLVSTYPKWMPVHWKEFSSPEGRFSVLMPGNPAAETRTPKDQPAELHMFTVDQGSKAFMASYFDLAPTTVSPDAILDGARDGSIMNRQGTLIKEERTALDGHPGRAFQATARGNSFVETRMYLVDRRLYMLTVVRQNREEDKDAAKFLSSFKLKPAAQ
jgi:hypothetical protein